MENTTKSIEELKAESDLRVTELMTELWERKEEYKLGKITKAEFKAFKKQTKAQLMELPFITGEQLKFYSWGNFIYGAAVGIGVAAIVAKVVSDKD